jgi:hypothetical protein
VYGAIFYIVPPVFVGAVIYELVAPLFVWPELTLLVAIPIEAVRWRVSTVRGTFAERLSFHSLE